VPTYGFIPTLDAEVATMAGYGIKGWFLAQDIPQLDGRMRRCTDWGNTDTKIFHAPANDTPRGASVRISWGARRSRYPVVSQGRAAARCLSTEPAGMLTPMSNAPSQLGWREHYSLARACGRFCCETPSGRLVLDTTGYWTVVRPRKFSLDAPRGRIIGRGMEDLGIRMPQIGASSPYVSSRLRMSLRQDNQPLIP